MSHFSFAVDEWTPELINNAPRLAHQVERYDVIEDLFFAITEHAEQIAELPGVRSFRRSSEGARRVVWCINHQVLIALAHRRTTGTNGIPAAAENWFSDGIPKYPTLTKARGERPRWGYDNDMRLPTRYCFVAALNISLEMKTRVAYDPDDPVSLAASAASEHLPVVIAAGNVNDDDDPTMFGWPCGPEIIAVGAVTPDMRRLHPTSRRGEEQRGIPGPDVVAVGLDESGEFGTSFAAPVVATQLALITAAFLALRAACMRVVTPGNAEGVPLVGRCFVDEFALPGRLGHGELVDDFTARKRKLPSLPIAGVRARSISPLLSDTAGKEHSILALPEPNFVRNLAFSSALPVPGEPPAHVGAGCLSEGSTLNSLLELRVGALRDLLGLPKCLGGNEPVFDELVLPGLLEGARDSMIGWVSDIREFGQEDPEPIFVEPASHGAPGSTP